MRDCLNTSVERFTSALCMGAREILNVREDKESKTEKYTLGPYKWFTYRDIHKKVNNIALGLSTLGMNQKDSMMFFADTSMEWQLALQACFQHGYVCTTTYANLGVNALAFGLKQANSKVLFTDAALIDSVSAVLDKCPSVKYVVYIPDKRPKTFYKYISDDIIQSKINGKGVKVLSIEQVEKFGEKLSASGEKKEYNIQPEDLCVIMYTSGSTGTPKGVMISNYNLVSTIGGSCTLIPNMGPGDFYLAYLPLAHILAMLTECGSIAFGSAIGYGSPKTLSDTSPCIDEGQCSGDAIELRPTLMAAVPAIMNKIHGAVIAKVKKTGGMTEKLFNKAYEAKLNAMKHGCDTPFWNRLIFDKLRAKLLGGRVRYMLSGGGPLSKSTQEFMNIVMCAPIGQGYGLTEVCGCCSIAWANDRTFGRAGAPVLSAQLALVDWEEGNYFIQPKNGGNPQGEILVGGPHVTMGYLGDEEKTRESYFEDADGRWFRTGDVGEFEPDGCIKIIDRKKDLVKLSGGEYISYGKIETVAGICKSIDLVMCYADSEQNYAILIATKPPNQNPDPQAVLKEIQQLCQEYKFPRFEIPSKILIVDDQWTPESDLVTAALKLKRKNIVDKYKDEIKKMYAEGLKAVPS